MSVILGYKFAAIPEWVLYHPELTGDDIRVFGVLARCGETAIPKVSTIAERTHLSERTVRRCRERLEAVGALWVECRHVEGRQTTNRYHLAGDQPVTPVTGRADTADRPEAVTADRGEADTGDRQNESKKEREQEERDAPSARAATARFEAWWDSYPRKVDPKKCATRWKRMTEAERAAAEDGLPKWVAYWAERAEPDKVPHPYTWLYNARWDAEPPAAPKPQNVAANPYADMLRSPTLNADIIPINGALPRGTRP